MLHADGLEAKGTPLLYAGVQERLPTWLAGSVELEKNIYIACLQDFCQGRLGLARWSAAHAMTRALAEVGARFVAVCGRCEASRHSTTLCLCGLKLGASLAKRAQLPRPLPTL